MQFHCFLSLVIAALLWVSAALPGAAHASVVISGTRVVYEAASGEKTVRLTNKGQSPGLVQAWLDTGEMQAERGALEVPFIISPPMSRIDPGKSQTLRILYTGEPLPQDRESVFWLNVLEVPPQPDLAPDQNFLQMSFRSRIKLFFRPVGLRGTAADAPALLTWQLATEGDHPALRVSNPTPYHVSFTAVELAAGGQTLAVEEPGMLAPFETRALALPDAVAEPSGASVRYRFINDYGGVVDGEAALQGPAR